MRLSIASLAVALAVVIVSAASADPYPHRKAGVWQMTRTSPDSKMPLTTAKLCIDAVTESALVDMGGAAAKKMCSKSDVHFSGKNGTVDTVCKFGSSTATTHSAITFKG